MGTSPVAPMATTTSRECRLISVWKLPISRETIHDSSVCCSETCEALKRSTNMRMSSGTLVEMRAPGNASCGVCIMCSGDHLRTTPAMPGYCVTSGCTTVVSRPIGLESFDGTSGLRFSANRCG